MNRRTFLIGTGASLAFSTLASRPLGQASLGVLSPEYPYRRVVDIMFAPMFTKEFDSDGEEVLKPDFPCRIKLTRSDSDDVVLLDNTISSRGFFRWLATPEGGFIVEEPKSLRFVVEPSCCSATLEMLSETKRPMLMTPADVIYEKFTWDDGLMARVVGPTPLGPRKELEESEPRLVAGWIRRLFG